MNQAMEDLNTSHSLGPSCFRDYSIRSSHTLCTQCTSIFSQARLDVHSQVGVPSVSKFSEINGSGKHHQKIHDLVTSAKNGCQLCVIIWTSLGTCTQEGCSSSDAAEGTDWRLWESRSGKSWTLIFAVGIEDVYLRITLQGQLIYTTTCQCCPLHRLNSMPQRTNIHWLAHLDSTLLTQTRPLKWPEVGFHHA